MPRHCAHHREDHNPSRFTHIDHPDPLKDTDPLGRLMPKLWEKHEEAEKDIFGSPDCDILGQVSNGLNTLTDLQIFHALAWMSIDSDPCPKKDKLNRAELDIVVSRMIRSRITIQNMYRLAASYLYDKQEQIRVTNEE